MFGTQEKYRKYTFLIICFSIFFLFSYGLAVGGEGSHEGRHESVQENGHGSSSGQEGNSHEAGHGGDRSGDLRDLFYRFINFALLFIILFVAIKKGGLKESLKSRIDEIGQKLDDLKKEKEDSETQYHEIEKKLRGFEEERKKIVEQFISEGLAQKGKIVSEARERAKHIVEQAELTIQQEILTAKDRLRQEVLDLATNKASEIITEQITDKDQDQLVNEFIERVDKIH